MTSAIDQLDAFKILDPLTYLRKFLLHSVRPDGRALEESRQIQIHSCPIAKCFGSATVKIGLSTVICAIKAEIAKPLPARPKDGYFVPNIDLPPLCSVKFRAGPPSQFTQAISEQINELFLKYSIC